MHMAMAMGAIIVFQAIILIIIIRMQT